MNQQELIASVIQEVLRQMDPAKAGSASAGASSRSSQPAGSEADGLFVTVDRAVDTATRAQQQLAAAGVEARKGIVQIIKSLSTQHADAWGKMELDETQLGRLDHKIAKLHLLQNVPGTEFLKTVAHSGDNGIGLDEGAPWGVIGVITPVTHSIPTISANAINMIAAGNSLVVNAHPSGAKCLAYAASVYNKAIKAKYNIDPLICVINPPTLRTAEEIFSHPRIPLLVATGGPAVARAAMKQTKRAIVAGPGNPPVVVDETANLDIAAQSIIQGGGFDNNLLCIGEKEVFVVASVFDKMMAAMRRAGAVELPSAAIEKLASVAFKYEKDHYVVSKDFVGKDPYVLAQAAGVSVPRDTPLLFGQTDESSPFVGEEQMMPFMPFVRVPDFEHALDLAIKHEHGYGHTAIIHSNNLTNITRMGQAMNTTLLAVNGPSTACLGIGGEGYASFSIATPTGEGVTNPMTFTRFRRQTVSGALRIV